MTNNQSLNLAEFVTSLTPATFGVSITTSTEPNMRKTGNPFVGRVRKVTTIGNAALRYNYERTINARLERDGKEGNYQAQKPSGRTFVVANLILVSDKEPSQKYLRVTWRKNTATKVEWELDGQIVTDEQVISQIKSFMVESKPCQKQLAAGLNEEDEVIVRDFKFESIKSIKQGERVWAA